LNRLLRKPDIRSKGELAPSFFRVRLWSQKELLQQLFDQCDKLDEALRAELPLKRIWTVAAQEEE